MAQPIPAFVKAAPPSQFMSVEVIYEKTNNAEKIMGNCWYLIANAGQANEMDVFWEYYDWPDKDGTKAEDKSWATNHTLTRVAKQFRDEESQDEKSRTTDYPYWYVYLTKVKHWYTPWREPETKVMKIQPRISERIPFPKKCDMEFVLWDEEEQAMAYHISILGGSMYFFFCKTPHMSDETYEKLTKKMQDECGVDPKFWNKTFWDENYKMGDTGEPINKL